MPDELDKDFREWKSSPAQWEKIKPLAREHRHTPTAAENLLWQHARNRRFDGVKFRREHGVERFIVDFYSFEAKLVIEVDGEIHQYTVEEDTQRQQFIESLGLRVVRFTNNQVLNSIDWVMEQIRVSLANLPSPPCES